MDYMLSSPEAMDHLINVPLFQLWKFGENSKIDRCYLKVSIFHLTVQVGRDSYFVMSWKAAMP